jgi:hypothetical protein
LGIVAPKAHLAGRILHRIVEKGKLTGDHLNVGIGEPNLSLEATGSHLLLHGCQTVLRNGEVGVNRIQTLDD